MAILNQVNKFSHINELQWQLSVSLVLQGKSNKSCSGFGIETAYNANILLLWVFFFLSLMLRWKNDSGMLWFNAISAGISLQHCGSLFVTKTHRLLTQRDRRPSHIGMVLTRGYYRNAGGKCHSSDTNSYWGIILYARVHTCTFTITAICSHTLNNSHSRR